MTIDIETLEQHQLSAENPFLCPRLSHDGLLIPTEDGWMCGNCDHFREYGTVEAQICAVPPDSLPASNRSPRPDNGLLAAVTAQIVDIETVTVPDSQKNGRNMTKNIPKKRLKIEFVCECGKNHQTFTECPAYFPVKE